MPRATSPSENLRRDLRRMASVVNSLQRRLVLQDARIRDLDKAMRTRARMEEILLGALGLEKSQRKGGRGIVGRHDDSILKIEDYLLKTGDRIESILKMLDVHREGLERMAKLSRSDSRDFMKMELDIMKNTLTILAMAGIEFDTDLVLDIDELKKKLEDVKAKIPELRKRKDELEKKLQDELKRYDLDTLYRSKTKIPGYL